MGRSVTFEAAGATVEYKYVTITSSGHVIWEGGPNRIVTIDGAGTDVVRQDAYRH